jgi:magnesium-transporting ATPase (P-type)
MDPHIIVTLIFIAFLITAFLTLGFFVWFTIHKSKEKERIVLLEKGYDPDDIPDRNMISFSWLKMGYVVTSMVIGLMIGLFMEELVEAAPVIGMFLFGGIGLIIAHYVDKPNGKS